MPSVGARPRGRFRPRHTAPSAASARRRHDGRCWADAPDRHLREHGRRDSSVGHALRCRSAPARANSVSDIPEAEARYLGAALDAAKAAQAFLAWMEGAGERLAPDRLMTLASDMVDRHEGTLRAVRTALDAAPAP